MWYDNITWEFNAMVVKVILTTHTVKTFWLLQPYFGHLSCMPDVCVTHYKTSKGCFLFESKLKCS